MVAPGEGLLRGLGGGAAHGGGAARQRGGSAAEMDQGEAAGNRESGEAAGHRESTDVITYFARLHSDVKKMCNHLWVDRYLKYSINIPTHRDR